MTDAYVREDLAVAGGVIDANAPALLDWAATVAAEATPAQIYRNKEGRKTLRFQLGQRSYFLKLHSGVGWAEIFKNLLQGRLPVLGAGNEYRAVQALRRIDVDTMSVAAYASEGRNPARQRSMIVTDDLVGTVSLEDYCRDWASAPPPLATRSRADSQAGGQRRTYASRRDQSPRFLHLPLSP